MIYIGRVSSKIKKSRYNYAMACIAKMKDIIFFQFTPEDIDYNKKEIRGTYYDGEKWATQMFPYPDYIYDRMLTRGRKHQEMYDVFSHIPFSNEKPTRGSISKVEMYQKIQRGGTFAKYLIPYKNIESLEDVHVYLSEYSKVICKPVSGNGGMNVYKIERKEKMYEVTENDEKNIYTRIQLDIFWEENVLKSNRRFLIQPFIRSQTLSGNPYDIRAHMMKNKNGEWEIAKLYPRIGKANGVVSNLHLGGSICSLWTFLSEHIKVDSPKEYQRKLQQFSKDVASHVEKEIDYHISEMGLDIGIDEDGKWYLFEVNVNRISVEYLPFEAADYAIAYGKYKALKNKVIN